MESPKVGKNKSIVSANTVMTRKTKINTGSFDYFRFFMRLIAILFILSTIWFITDQTWKHERENDILFEANVSSQINVYEATINNIFPSLTESLRDDYINFDNQIQSYVRVKNSPEHNKHHYSSNARKEDFASINDALDFLHSKGFTVQLFQLDYRAQREVTSYCHRFCECERSKDDLHVTNVANNEKGNNKVTSKNGRNRFVTSRNFPKKRMAYAFKNFLRSSNEEMVPKLQEDIADFHNIGQFIPSAAVAQSDSSMLERNEQRGTTSQRRLANSINNSENTLFNEDMEKNVGTKENWEKILSIILPLLGAIICICIAALAAGLTLGMLGLDPLMLLIKERAAIDPEERLMASKILPIVKKHHQLLVSLLLMNSIANEALPIFLEQSKILSPVACILISVVFVLFFGEIIPSAVFTGPNQLCIASNLVPLVNIVMVILYPVAGPIAKLLDYLLHEPDESHRSNNQTKDGDDGHDEALFSKYNRTELAALIRIQYEEKLANKRKSKIDRQNVRNSYKSVDTINGDRTSVHRAARSVEYDLERQVSLSHDEWRRVINVYQHHAPPNQPNQLLLTETKSSGKQPHHLKRDEDDIAAPTLARYTSGPVDNNLASKIESDRLIREDSIELDEVMMVEGALQMKTKVAFDVFTPIRNVYAVPKSMILNEKNMVQIYASGYSRIPVYDDSIDSSSSHGSKRPRNPKSAIIGVLVTKLLIVVNPNDERTVGSLPLRTPQCVSPATPLFQLVNVFQTGGAKGGHQALVCAFPSVGNQALATKGACLPEGAGLLGIITFEDVIEELLQEEIYDEKDLQHRAGMRLADWVVRQWRAHSAKRLIKTTGSSQKAPFTIEEDSQEDGSDKHDAIEVRNKRFYFYEKDNPSENTALLGCKSL